MTSINIYVAYISAYIHTLHLCINKYIHYLYINICIHTYVGITRWSAQCEMPSLLSQA